MMIWDTAGQEEFDAMTKAYYRGAVAAPVFGTGRGAGTHPGVCPQTPRPASSPFRRPTATRSRPSRTGSRRYRGALFCGWLARVVQFTTTRHVAPAQVEAEVGSLPMVLVQNKVDLMDRAVMTKEEANAKAEKVRPRAGVVVRHSPATGLIIFDSAICRSS